MAEVIKVSNGWLVRIMQSEHGRTVNEFVCKEWAEVLSCLDWAKDRGWL